MKLWVTSAALTLAACTTGGSAWVAESALSARQDDPGSAAAFQPPPEPTAYRGGLTARRIGVPTSPEVQQRKRAMARSEGRVVGTFRNTYYDFPTERGMSGPQTALFDGKCQVIAQVPEEFHDAVCVQGSGQLASGTTVSFARRDCECARVCPRTGHRICFDALDRERFPWGRGAMGRAITPLLTVAVDSDEIPLGTPLYIPEYDGLPRDSAGASLHDGCFIAQDRGSRVKGQHVDVFTGDPSLTRYWNHLVPSNRGVSVVLDSPRCRRAD